MQPVLRDRLAQLFRAAQEARADGRLHEALKTLDTMRALAPVQPPAQLLQAEIDIAFGQTSDATATLRDLLTKAAPPPDAMLRIADLFARAGASDDALAIHDRLIAASPKSIKPQADKASFLQSTGDFAAAEKIFRKLLKKHPFEAELYRIFIPMTKLAKGDPLIPAMRKALAHPKMTAIGKMHLNFALAKALEDTGATAKVFRHLDAGNALQQRAFPIDWPAREAEHAGYLAAQSAALPSASGARDMRPVFVIGMPRSGTTLVERILARHSEVGAGGEMGHALRLLLRRFGGPDGLTPLNTATPGQINSFAEGYTGLVRASTGQTTPVVTDKSIQTQLLIGLLHAAFPQASFIIVQRDPRDIALSIYKNYFRDGTHRYSNTLPDIARAIGDFRAQVAHWDRALPGLLHHVHYEDLVSDPAAQIPALIKAAGLDWQDACLDDQAPSGQIKTLSMAQARQPIHANRRAAWKTYEAEMAPFLDAWKGD